MLIRASRKDAKNKGISYHALFGTFLFAPLRFRERLLVFLPTGQIEPRRSCPGLMVEVMDGVRRQRPTHFYLILPHARHRCIRSLTFLVPLCYDSHPRQHLFPP